MAAQPAKHLNSLLTQSFSEFQVEHVVTVLACAQDHRLLHRCARMIVQALVDEPGDCRWFPETDPVGRELYLR
jgi:hypothetical protein